MKDPTSVVDHALAPAPVEASRAQMRAEMQHASAYRSQKMAFYRKWSSSGGDVKATFGVDLQEERKKAEEVVSVPGFELPWVRQGKTLNIKEKS